MIASGEQSIKAYNWCMTEDQASSINRRICIKCGADMINDQLACKRCDWVADAKLSITTDCVIASKNMHGVEPPSSPVRKMTTNLLFDEVGDDGDGLIVAASLVTSVVGCFLAYWFGNPLLVLFAVLISFASVLLFWRFTTRSVAAINGRIKSKWIGESAFDRLRNAEHDHVHEFVWTLDDSPEVLRGEYRRNVAPRVDGQIEFKVTRTNEGCFVLHWRLVYAEPVAGEESDRIRFELNQWLDCLFW